MIAFLVYRFPYLVFMDLECICHMTNESCDLNAAIFVVHLAWIKVSLNVLIIFEDDD